MTKHRGSSSAIVAAALCLGSAAAAASAQEVAAPIFTLADAVRLALRHSGSIHDAAGATEEARIARQVAQSAFRPKLVPHVLGAIGGPDTISNQRYGLDVFQRFPRGTEFQAAVGTSSSRNQLGTFYYSDTTISVTQPLFGGGRDALRGHAVAAEGRLQDALEEEKGTQRRVVVEVASAYYAIVAQRQVVIVAERSLERSQRLLEVSEAKLAIGKVSQLDVLRARQLVREAQSQLLDAQAIAEDAADQLRLLTGRPPDDAFSVESRIPDVLPRPPLDAAALSAALAQRPELLRASRAVTEAERAADTARRPLPRVDVRLALTRRVTADSFRSSFGLGGFRLVPFVGISMPVDGDAAGRARALADLDRRRHELQALKTKLQIEARQAARQHARLLRGVAEADAAVDFAQKQVDVARARFERGLSNNLDLVSAEADLLLAESRRMVATAALAVAELNLEVLLGTMDPAHDFKS